MATPTWGLWPWSVNVATRRVLSADVDGNVEATKSTFQGYLNLHTARVKGSILLYGSKFTGTVICSGGTIGGALSLFRRDQRGIWRAIWDESAGINLQGSTVGGIEDIPEAWPSRVHVVGFVMQGMRGEGTAAGQGFIDRKDSWYLDWLRRDRGRFSGGPYKQLETLLRSAGKRKVADSIAMERIKQEYTLEGGLRNAIGWLHRRTVGYGYRPEWAIFWIVGLILISWLILIGWGVADKHVLMPISWLMMFGWGTADKHVLMSNLEKNGVTSRLVLSAQRLIPLINFGKGYEDVDITSKAVPWWVRWYFYLHAMLGYILAAFLLTALARVTTT